MLLTIITLFPQIFDSIFAFSIIARAQKEDIIKIETIDLRKFGIGVHKQVDDKPYGGGTGMVLRVDILDAAIKSVRLPDKKSAVILLDPKGQIFKQELAEKLSSYEHLIFVCGRYEGFDERVRELVDFEVSIGDFVLSGGEIAAAAIIEAVTRLVPGVLKKEDASTFESFSEQSGKRYLEHPHYTRPEVYNKKRVPKTLLSGNFKKIENFRTEKARLLTKKRRPDLV